MENILIVLLLFWFIYFGYNYAKCKQGYEEFALDLLKITLTPIKLLILVIWKIMKLLKKKGK